MNTIQGPGGELRLRARVRERHGESARLSAVSWEPLVPRATSSPAAFRCGRLDMLGIAASFGTSALAASGELDSRPIPLPGVTALTGPLVIKVVGTDSKGRRVAAWADLNSEAIERWASLSGIRGALRDERRRIPKAAWAIVVAVVVIVIVIAVPVLADEIKGKIKSIDRARSEIVVADEKTEKDVTVSLGALSKGLGKNDDLKDLKEGKRVTVDNAFVAAKITLEDEKKSEEGHEDDDPPGVLAQFHAQPVQAVAAVFLPGVSGPDPQGGVRVPLRDLPGPDDLPAAGDRLARRRRAGEARV